MFRYRITAVVFFLVTSLATAAYGGKLGSIRNKASGNSNPKSSSSASEENDREPERTQRSQPAPRRERKLESIRTATRRETPRQRETARSHERVSSRPRHGRRRPNRGGANLGFFFDSSPRCEPMTTIVEEYHYYPNSPFAVAPVATVQVPLSPAPVYEQPPVMPAEPQIFDSCDQFASEPTPTILAAQDPFLSDFNLRFEIDSAADEDDVNRTGFGLLFNATGGLGIDTGVRIFREHDADFRDHMWIGDFNVVYELLPTEFARTRAGIGFNWLADRYGSEGGLNLTVGSDLFAGPLVFSGEVDLGTLGDADLLHGRVTVAARPGDHLEVFAGYDYLDIGGVEIRGVVGGVRFRF